MVDESVVERGGSRHDVGDPWVGVSPFVGGNSIWLEAIGMRGWGSTVDLILGVLNEIGPMTRVEMGSHLEMDRQNLSAVVTRMNRPGKTYPKRIYIMGYVFDNGSDRRYPRAVYALGDKPDVRRPKSDVKANKRRYRAALKSRMTMNSVFNLGLTRREYEAIARSTG